MIYVETISTWHSQVVRLKFSPSAPPWLLLHQVEFMLAFFRENYPFSPVGAASEGCCRAFCAAIPCDRPPRRDYVYETISAWLCKWLVHLRFSEPSQAPKFPPSAPPWLLLHQVEFMLAFS